MASVDGAVGEDEGSSVVVGTKALGSATVETTFGSIGDRTMLTSEPTFAASVG